MKIGNEGLEYSDELEQGQVSEPMVKHIHTADPSAHVFDGEIYIYPSHDIDSEHGFDDDGGHFQMEDYHVFSLEKIGGEIVDHGVILDITQVPWAEKQLWDSDVAHKDGIYYLYFSAKAKDGLFYIGVATSKSPKGPFRAEEKPIKTAYSIDPCSYEDEDGKYYVYFGGLWGGQLQNYRNNIYSPEGTEPKDSEPALYPKVAQLSDDMLQFKEEPRDLVILDENNQPITAGDHDRRFFEASWMHKYKGKYYFSYSTGNTHNLCYAIGDNPYGPFTYKGVIMPPVIGWTTHHSIAHYKGKWYLFYHDCVLSKGVTHLRNIKMTELTYDENGLIKTIIPYIV